MDQPASAAALSGMSHRRRVALFTNRRLRHRARTAAHTDRPGHRPARPRGGDPPHQRAAREAAADRSSVKGLPSLPWLRLTLDPYAAVESSDVVVIATEWPEFRVLDWPRLARLMNRRLIFDARGFIPAEGGRAAGVRLHSLERRSVNVPTADEAEADVGAFPVAPQAVAGRAP